MSNIKDLKKNVILFYADFLSLKKKCYPVTDNCTYFFIHNTPINSAYILDLEPNYDKDNEFIKQAEEEYDRLYDKFGESGAMSFISNLCNVSACGTANALLMLKCINRYNTKIERK